MAMTHAAGRLSAGDEANGATLFAGAGWPMIVFIWAVFSIATAINGFPGVIDKFSTDDAMRLVEVRDLLAGQSWYDLVQHRMNPPDGLPMHWSRLIDLPIALILGGLRLVVSEQLATELTVTIWPALLFLPALIACAAACRTLAGPAAGVIGAFMMVMSPGVATRYAPGAIDHHGAQIALALILLACALRLDRSLKAGIGAGLAAAVMMAIGMETAPHVAAVAGLIALRWAISGDEGMARGAAAFGLSFAGGLAVISVATLSPEAVVAPVCDAVGVGHIVAAGLGGVGLALATRFGGSRPLMRFAALAQIGVAVGAGIALVAPECLAAPFASLPERVVTDWLSRVQEAQNIIASTIDQPTSSFAIGMPLLVLVGVAVWAVATAPKEKFWPIATAAAMCAVSCAVTVWQIRGSSLAFALGGVLLPVAALAVGRAFGRLWLGLAVMGFSPAAIALSALGVADIVGMPPIPTQADFTCPSADFAALDAATRNDPVRDHIALNAIDTGPFVLAHTGMSAVAGPYHRNVDGILAALDAFNGSDETARAVAVSRRAAYIVLCPFGGEATHVASKAPEGFAAALIAGQTPSWLEPIDLGSHARLKAYRVTAGSAFSR